MSALHGRITAVKRLTVELIPDPALGGYTARVPDIPAYGEGETEEEAIADLKEASSAYVEAFGLDAIEADPEAHPTDVDFWKQATVVIPRS